MSAQTSSLIFAQTSSVFKQTLKTYINYFII